MSFTSLPVTHIRDRILEELSEHPDAKATASSSHYRLLCQLAKIKGKPINGNASHIAYALDCSKKQLQTKALVIMEMYLFSGELKIPSIYSHRGRLK